MPAKAKKKSKNVDHPEWPGFKVAFVLCTVGFTAYLAIIMYLTL